MDGSEAFDCDSVLFVDGSDLGRLTVSSSNPSGMGENWISAAAVMDRWTGMSLGTRTRCARVGDVGSIDLEGLDLSWVDCLDLGGTLDSGSLVDLDGLMFFDGSDWDACFALLVGFGASSFPCCCSESAMIE